MTQFRGGFGGGFGAVFVKVSSRGKKCKKMRSNFDTNFIKNAKKCSAVKKKADFLKVFGNKYEIIISISAW